MHISSPEAKRFLQRDIRLAFFDIDGTLLGLDGNYTKRVRQAIHSVQARGVKTAVASGRPLFAADFLVRELGLNDAGLFYTGALLHNPQTGESLAEHPLEQALVDRLLTAAKQMQVYIEVCGRHRFYVEAMTPLGQLHSQHLRAVPEMCAFGELEADEVVIKLLFAVSDTQDHAKLYALEKRFPDAVFAYAKMAAKPDWLFVSVISSRACKQTGFQQLLEYHGVTADQVISFGDAQSDKTFLQLSGVGVAMGNAADDVKALADIVTTPVWEDGVAVVLEHLAGS